VRLGEDLRQLELAVARGKTQRALVRSGFDAARNPLEAGDAAPRPYAQAGEAAARAEADRIGQPPAPLEVHVEQVAARFKLGKSLAQCFGERQIPGELSERLELDQVGGQQAMLALVGRRGRPGQAKTRRAHRRLARSAQRQVARADLVAGEHHAALEASAQLR
jgi:hypothetical protein